MVAVHAIKEMRESAVESSVSGCGEWVSHGRCVRDDDLRTMGTARESNYDCETND